MEFHFKKFTLIYLFNLFEQQCNYCIVLYKHKQVRFLQETKT